MASFTTSSAWYLQLYLLADHTHKIQSDNILGWSEIAIDTENEAQAKYSQHLLNTINMFFFGVFFYPFVYFVHAYH